jgi:hypothetical protein
MLNAYGARSGAGGGAHVQEDANFESFPVCAGDGHRSSAVYKSEWTFKFKGRKDDYCTQALVSWTFPGGD